jgi:probable phosphoglycerate mutase
MELVLVRHAEPHRVDVTDHGGPADPALTDRGREQAEALAAWLRDDDVAAVLTSPLRRAVETAAPVAAALGYDLEIVDDLAEYDRNSTTYIPIEDLRGTDTPEWDAMQRGQLHEVADGDPTAFRQRVVDGIESIVDRHAGQTVVVVTHGGVINAYVGHVLGIDTPLWFEPRYAAVTRVAAQTTGRRLRSLVTLNEGPRPGC